MIFLLSKEKGFYMYERNLEAISNQDLKVRLGQILIEDSKREMSYCMTRSNDYLLMKHDMPFDDLDDPRKAIQEHFKNNIKNPMGKNDIIINFGIGLGYLLDETFNTYESRIIVYEPDIELLHFVLHNVDISEHLKSGRVFITDKINELLKYLTEIYLTKDKVEIVYLKNYAVFKNKELLELTQKVFDACRSKMVDVNTITKFSKKWLLNTIRNIGTVNKSEIYKLSDLENKFAGQTALILAAGPSLNDNIEKIKANRDKYVIFAVNKVLNTLSNNGIVPDFAVFLDPSFIKYTISGLEEFCKKINCITDIKSDSYIFSKNFKKTFVSFSTNDMVIKKLSEYNSIRPYETGGTATTFALVSAIKLGFSRIILSGMDLAFKDGLVYSSGQVSSNGVNVSIGQALKKVVKVKSVTGAEVETREDYAAYIKHVESIIKEFGYSEIYNTTSFGAEIQGVKNVSFEDLRFGFPITGTSFILGEAKPFKIETEKWTQEELMLINNVISLLSKGVFSPALIDAIVKSPLMYQYMQDNILKLVQSNFEADNAESFIESVKLAVKDIVENLQKNRLI